MTPVALSLFFFVVGTFLLWLANRAATPKGVTFDQSLSVNRRLEVAPVAVTAVLVYWGLTALLARPVSVFCLSVLGIVLLLAGNALKVKLLGEVLLFPTCSLPVTPCVFRACISGMCPSGCGRCWQSSWWRLRAKWLKNLRTNPFACLLWCFLGRALLLLGRD